MTARRRLRFAKRLAACRALLEWMTARAAVVYTHGELPLKSAVMHRLGRNRGVVEVAAVSRREALEREVVVRSAAQAFLQTLALPSDLARHVVQLLLADVAVY